VTSGQPELWTLIEFEADDADADAEPLAGLLADALAQPCGWYGDFRSPWETWVVFAGQIFRYPRGDTSARAEAEAYARSRGVPESQLDWPA